MKTAKVCIAAVTLAIMMALNPIMIFAGTETMPIMSNMQASSRYADTDEALFKSLSFMFGVTMRPITLTPEAKTLVLYDLDYLFAKILATAPAQNIIQRRLGLSAADYFAEFRNIAYTNTLLPSFLSILYPERWVNPPSEARYIAADYLFTLLALMEWDLEGLGHFHVQESTIAHQMFVQLAIYEYHGIDLSENEINAFVDAGFTTSQVETFIDANLRFNQLLYEIYNTPSVLWFYDIDPASFEMDLDLGEFLGFASPDNIFTYIIEEDIIAYVHIASFAGNLQADRQILWPFFEEIQHFENLIIDIRGNGGGFTTYFPHLIFNVLVNEASHFTSYEFFIASEKTEAFFLNPIGLCGGVLYAIRPAAEFVAERGFEHFNPDDLALLDYVIIRENMTKPSADGIPFNGKIWLLVDGDSASASESAAILSAATGFATVVGEPTAGITGVLYTVAALPNTGMLFVIDLGYTIDAYGRSIEEFGFIPHILNMPNMDALDTVLAIIYENTSPSCAANLTAHFDPPPWPQ